jgi:hypothetical protein
MDIVTASRDTAANAAPLVSPLRNMSWDDSEEPEAAIPKADAIPEVAWFEISTVADPTSTAVDGSKFEALTSAAILLLPEAVRAADAAAARREASGTSGVPVRIVPFAKAPERTAARLAADVKPAAALITAAPLEAAFTAATVTPAGSAAYDAADAVAVELSDAENIAFTRIVTITDPSMLVYAVGETDIFEGATPPVAISIASYADEMISLCRAATTPESAAYAGKANERVSVNGTLTVSVKLM